MARRYPHPTPNYDRRRQSLIEDLLAPTETRVQMELNGEGFRIAGFRVRLPCSPELDASLVPNPPPARVAVQWLWIAPEFPSPEKPFMWGCDVIIDRSDSSERASFYVEARNTSDLGGVLAAAESQVLLLECDDGQPMAQDFQPGLIVKNFGQKELTPALKMFAWLNEGGGSV